MPSAVLPLLAPGSSGECLGRPVTGAATFILNKEDHAIANVTGSVSHPYIY